MKALYRYSLFIIALFSFILLSIADAQCISHGKVLESLKMESNIMGKPVKYTIYLPPDYETSQRRYPVVYLLHGFSDNDMGWIQFGEANRTADVGIASGEIPPMIIVMPDGGVTWYTNDYKGKEPWADMFIKEFIPYIDATYRTRPKKEFRGISGLSMGGYGALQTAMRNPDTFAACAAFSSGVFTKEEITNLDDDSYQRYFKNIFGKDLKGEDRYNKQWQAFDPLTLLNSVPFEKLKSIRWYLDCGDDDFLYRGNSALHVRMRNMKLPHEYRVRNGSHSWSYWRSGLKDALAFIGISFHR